MDEKFKILRLVLSFLGIPIFYKLNWNCKLYLAHQIFNFIIILLIFIFTTGFVFISYSDKVIWIEGACIWITGVIVFISLTVTLVYRREFREFVEEMAFKDSFQDMPLIAHILQLELHGKLIELKDKVLKSQAELMKYTKLLLKVYLTCVLSVALLYISDAMYKMINRKDDSERILAYNMWFPWSLQNIYVYIATFVFHTYAGFICAVTFPAPQTVIVLLIGQVIRQIQILAFILLHLDELATELAQDNTERWQDYCSSILSQCVDQYAKIKRFSNQLNIICRPFYLAVILDAIMLLCVCSVKIAISNKTSPDTMKYYMHEFFFVLMVLLFCVLGQRVQNECENLETVVTEKWYIFNKNHKVDVQIFSTALSQGMDIYIFGSITLSLPTFTWFIKTGMSFFTLVMSVIED